MSKLIAFSPDWLKSAALTPAGFQAERAAAQADAAPPTERLTRPPLTLELSVDAQPRRVANIGWRQLRFRRIITIT